MKLNINFLQTKGVPLTNDLMEDVMSAIKLYDAIGGLAGNLTIISGCEIIGNNVSSGVVAIDNELLFFEGGSIVPTVYIHTEPISKTFQDQVDRVLIEYKTVKFGNGSVNYNWADFIKLKTLKEIQNKVENSVSKTDFDLLEKRVNVLELKTAPIVNGGIVVIWRKDEIPAGWKECLDIRGKTVVGWNPNESEFETLGGAYGAKQHTLNVNELPNLQGSMYTIAPNWDFGSGIISATNSNNALISGGNSSYIHKQMKINFGANTAHNNIQPSIAFKYIEPNFQ